MKVIRPKQGKKEEKNWKKEKVQNKIMKNKSKYVVTLSINVAVLHGQVM